MSIARSILHLGHKHSEQHAQPDRHGKEKKKDYEMTAKPIGEGGYSQVVKATWKTNGNMVVAMKVVRKEAIKDREEYLKIIGPGFARINTYPNVCAGLDWFESNSKYYIAFPLLTGGELLAKLNDNGRFTEEATAKVLVVMLSTLAYVHSHGIIHRDIKPDNFLYRHPDSQADDLVLIDFGISKILDDDDDSSGEGMYETAGTPGYAAPEVFFGKGYGKKSDCFGVGVIAYNLLTAWSPWAARDTIPLIQETSQVHINFPEEPLRGVSAEAVSFVKSMLQPPSRRPTAKEALSHPWLSHTASLRPIHNTTVHAPHPAGLEPEQIAVHSTLKPDHAIARQMTAGEGDLLGHHGGVYR